MNSKIPNPNIPGVFDVLPEEVHERANELILIDVRRPDEYVGELGHISGSQLIVLDELPMRLEEIPKEKVVIFVCRSGARSASATQFALENGYQSVFNMRGGMMAWNQLQFEVEGRQV